MIFKSWIFWLILFIAAFFIIWCIYGGGDHEFVGLKPIYEALNSPDYQNINNIDDDDEDDDDSRSRSSCKTHSTYKSNRSNISKSTNVTNRSSRSTRDNRIRLQNSESSTLKIATDPKNSEKSEKSDSNFQDSTRNLNLASNSNINQNPNPNKNPTELEFTPIDRNMRCIKNMNGIVNINKYEYIQVLQQKEKYDLTRKGKKKVSKGETICRYYFEKIYNAGFPTSYPDFLKNPETNGQLELDGYNKELGIAFEFQGRQHYNSKDYISVSHNSDENAFIQQIRRDDLKYRICNEVGIYLIIIPEMAYDEILDYIISKLPKF